MAAFFQSIVNHIYTLPLLKLMYLSVYFGMIFNALWGRFAQRYRWRAYCGTLLGAWACAVLWVTVFSRQPGSISQVHWLPLSTYWRFMAGENSELMRSSFMNMLLFFPGGLFYAGLTAPKSQSSRAIITLLLIFGLFSFGIELTQGLLALGTAEADDVLHNILGAAAGFAVFQVDMKTKNE